MVKLKLSTLYLHVLVRHCQCKMICKCTQSQDEMEVAYIPEITRTELEHRTPFTDPNSKVSKAGLELLQFEVKSGSWQERYRDMYTEDITPKTQSGNLLIYLSKFMHILYCHKLSKTQDKIKGGRKKIIIYTKK